MNDPTVSMFPYVFMRAVDRERPGTRIEARALDNLRDLVAWLQLHGAPASLEQELTVAVVSHVACLAARFGVSQFPKRQHDLPPGRRRDVWRLAPQPVAGAADDNADSAPVEVQPSSPVEPNDVSVISVEPITQPITPGIRRAVSRLASQETDQAIAALLGVDIASVQQVTQRWQGTYSRRLRRREREP